MINLAVTNLGKYNEGELIFEWLTLPCTDEEIENTFKKIGINEEYEEYFITDWEVDSKIEGIEISEYSSLTNLNDLAHQLEELNEWDLEVVGAIMRTWDYEVTKAIEVKDEIGVIQLDKNSTLNDEENMAYTYIEEVLGGITGLSKETLERYFDYEAFGRDLLFDYTVDDETMLAVSNY